MKKRCPRCDKVISSWHKEAIKTLLSDGTVFRVFILHCPFCNRVAGCRTDPVDNKQDQYEEMGHFVHQVLETAVAKDIFQGKRSTENSLLLSPGKEN